MANKELYQEVDMEKMGYTYVVTNKYNNVLYIGVTTDLVRRAAEHKAGIGCDFTRAYRCVKLVYFEVFPDIDQAVQREKLLKTWKRAWKVALIEERNPEWKDLSVGMGVNPMTDGK